MYTILISLQRCNLHCSMYFLLFGHLELLQAFNALDFDVTNVPCHCGPHNYHISNLLFVLLQELRLFLGVLGVQTFWD